MLQDDNETKINNPTCVGTMLGPTPHANPAKVISTAAAGHVLIRSKGNHEHKILRENFDIVAISITKKQLTLQP